MPACSTSATSPSTRSARTWQAGSRRRSSRRSTSASAAIGVIQGLTGIHFSIWLVLIAAGIVTALAGVIIGLPTLRLRGDYLAIVTLGFGEILPHGRPQRGQPRAGFNLTNGTGGITPIDPPGFGNWFAPSPRSAGELRRARNDVRPRLLLDRARPRPDHDLLQRAPARLAPRPRVDRDSRGRGRGRRDGRSAHAHEDVGVRDRRVLRRGRGRVLRELQRQLESRTSSTSRSRSSSSSWSSSAGWATSGASSSGRASSRTSTSRGSTTSAPGSTATSGRAGPTSRSGTRRSTCRCTSSGSTASSSWSSCCFRPEGLIPSRRRAAEFHEGVHDQPLYDAAV